MENENQSNYYLESAIQLVIILCLILVPVFFTTTIHNAFTIEKHVIFRFCTLAILGLTAIKWVYYPRKILFPRVFWLVPLFWVAALVSTMLAVNPIVSWWGIHLRMDGLVNLTFLVSFFVLIYINIDSRQKLNQIIWTIALTSIIPVGYAFAQRLGWDPINWKDVLEEERVFGTTGNPAYLGAYIMFTLPITLYLAFVKDGWKRYGMILLSICQVIIIFLTMTRAAFLGMTIELMIIFLVYLFVTKREKIAQIALVMFVIMIVFVLSLNINSGFKNIFGGNRYIERISTILNTTEGTNRDRIEMWKISAKAIGERPVFGSGLTAYYTYFNKYYPNYMDSKLEKDRYSNYSHNFILDNGVAFGLVGLTLILSIFGGYIYLVWRKAVIEKLEENKLLYTALGVSMLGYLVQAMFNIETIITWLYSYTFLAITLIAIYRFEQDDDYVKKDVNIWSQAGLTVFIMSTMVGIYFLAVNPARADQIYYNMNDTSLSYEKKMEMAVLADQLTPYFEFSKVKMADLHSGAIDYDNLENAKELYQKTVDHLQKAIAISPNNYKNYLSMATIYGNWAKIDKSKIDDTDKYFAEAKKLSPNRLGLEYAWGNVYLDLGLIDKSLDHFLEAKKLNPEVGETYYYLAKIDALENKLDAAKANLEKAKELGYAFDEAVFYESVAMATYQSKNYQQSLMLANKANSIKPRETAVLIEIQSCLDLSRPAEAEKLVAQYANTFPGIKEKFYK